MASTPARAGSATYPLDRALAEQAFSRTTGAPLVAGNRVELLLDGPANYPEWLAAIDAAERHIHLEMYIFHDDEVGQRFAERLAARAHEGVAVRILYDWLGCFGTTRRRFWERLRRAGCEVRVVNPPRIDAPLGWIARDHRKLLVVDGRVAFVSGLCIGRHWAGDPERDIEPWRDTGLRLEGPVVADAEASFAEVWASNGEPLAKPPASREEIAPAGERWVRLVQSTPQTARLFRVDLVVASLARRSLWLTDAYFYGHAAYLDALRAAAEAGVDVRLLVPGASDLPLVATFSRTLYRPLLVAGVRVFEWNGRMLHAKAAVADGRWARVGSSNLNSASWFGNWELDVAVEDESFAAEMEQTYERDLERSTEIVLERRRVRRRDDAPQEKHLRGSANRATAAALRLGGVVGAGLARPRPLGAAEAASHASLAAGLVALAVLALVFPIVVAAPLALLAMVVAVSLLTRAWRARRDPWTLPGAEPDPKD